MYEAWLEFRESWGGLGKNPFRGEGMDNFWNHTIHSFKNHILVTWPATNLLIIFEKNGVGLKNLITIILFKIWPTNCFLKANSYNFHFHKNDVTWPPSAWPTHFPHIGLFSLSHRECINLQKGSSPNKK